jgi:ubiquinone/menaquinone biosynthesis C-methylase UbiE
LLRARAPPNIFPRLNATDSKYVEKKSYLSRLAHHRELAFREDAHHLETEFGSEAEWLRCVREEFPKFIPFLRKSGLEFRGRILEIGSGAAWFSAELSKLPKVVEVVATDFSPKLLKEQAPKIFKLLNAHGAKITRMPADFHRLDFPNNYFDFVACSAVLHHAVNMVTVLREAKRVLKPGGQFVAIREPVWPLVKLKSRSKTQAKLVDAGVNEHFYTLVEYREFFAQAGFQMEARRVNLSSGMKYFFNQVVNGLTHARYAFVAKKRSA